MSEQRAKSTAAGRPLKAARAALLTVLVGVFAGALATPARAQHSAVVWRDNESFLSEPGGTRLGRLISGVTVATGSTRDGHTQVSLDGWVFGRSLRQSRRDGHSLAIRRSPEENLREAPSGRVLARLGSGALLDEVERRGEWVHVRRAGWVASAALGAPPPAAAAARARDSAGAAAAAQAAPEEPDAKRALARRRLQLYRAPDAAPAGALEAGVPVRIIARAGHWVRVEAQGWVKENEIRVSSGGILDGVTAAELRATPDEFRGKLLRWTIQFIALQTADDLRPDFAPGQKYILARGPAPEYAFVYVIVPPERLSDVSRLMPLRSVEIVARVVNGRSMYLANPILQLVDIAQ